MNQLNLSNCVIDTSIIQAVMTRSDSFERANHLIQRIEQKLTKAFMSVEGLRDLLVPVFDKFTASDADKLEQTITNQLGVSVRPTSRALAIQAAQFVAACKVSPTLATHMAMAKELQILLIVDYDVDAVSEWDVDSVEIVNVRVETGVTSENVEPV